MFIRDILVDGVRNFSARKGIVLPANFSGKSKMLLQVVSVGFGLAFLHAGRGIPFFFTASNVTLSLAFFISLLGIPILIKKLRQSI